MADLFFLFLFHQTIFDNLYTDNKTMNNIGANLFYLNSLQYRFKDNTKIYR